MNLQPTNIYNIQEKRPKTFEHHSPTNYFIIESLSIIQRTLNQNLHIKTTYQYYYHQPSE
ncbi:hypothetical protein G9A89_013273 [Geosiphon pyriformis]|nr:hypothetical protein G9A89_013273 [Geosiphon pyriformis]